MILMGQDIKGLINDGIIKNALVENIQATSLDIRLSKEFFFQVKSSFFK